MEIKSETIMDGWREGLKQILNKGSSLPDNDGRIFKELINMVVEINNPLKDPDKPIDILNSFKKWVYPNKKELKNLIIEKEPAGIYGFTYGPRIFNFENRKDQIHSWVIPLLKKSLHSRRAVISLFNPLTDLDMSKDSVPSLMNLHFMIRDKKLNLTLFIRSNEFFIGWPANIFQLVCLYEYVADKLIDGEKYDESLKKGKITTISSSAHIYEENFDYVKEILSK
ncbi:hypothetical protein JW949_04305 [Candidatus Woesearchaeota archaeon]|nr:hypothetical protein [Candidatus Woesearchaeota archaeon]